MRSYRGDYRFRPAKRKPAAYFNDGEGSYSVQHDPDSPDKKPNPKLIRAIKSARDEFFRIWNGPDEEPAQSTPGDPMTGRAERGTNA